MQNPFLIAEKIYLRAPEESDSEISALCENHPDPRHSLYYARPTSRADHARRLATINEDATQIHFIICRRKDDVAIGMTAFVRIDWVGRMCTFYIAIARKEDWSKGYGGETCRLMLDYAFNTLNLNRVQLHVSVENEKAVRAYKSAGFEVEGTMRQAMYHEGHYSDFYLMAILRRDYQRV